MFQLSPHYVFNVIARANYLMKRISLDQFEALERHYHALYRNLQITASVIDLPTASQVKAALAKAKSSTDKCTDRIHATEYKATVFYAREAIKVNHLVFLVNATDVSAKKENLKAILDDHVAILKRAFAFWTTTMKYNDDEDYFSKNSMAIPNFSRNLSIIYQHNHGPNPIAAKRDLENADRINGRKAIDLEIMSVNLDSHDATLLQIPAVNNISNKDMRSMINKSSLDLIESFHCTQSSSTVQNQKEIPADENEEYFLSLFMQNQDIKSTDATSQDTSMKASKVDKSQEKVELQSTSQRLHIIPY